MGSLIAAVASYLDARKNRGVWLLRVDDLDPPREVPGAATSILNSLQRHGLHWDEDVLWQSRRHSAYQHALSQLKNRTFLCNCSRAMLGPNGSCQAGCQVRQQELSSPFATRIPVPQGTLIHFADSVRGPQEVALGHTSGNFLIHRKDGLYAYQLAVVVDDAHQGITHIVRGSDLLDTTARQIFLQQALGFTTPEYCHVPVISNALGHKFSKQSHAPALENKNAKRNLRTALKFLCQPRPPDELDTPAGILMFATRSWTPQLIPKAMSIPAEQQNR